MSAQRPLCCPVCLKVLGHLDQFAMIDLERKKAKILVAGEYRVNPNTFIGGPQRNWYNYHRWVRHIGCEIKHQFFHFLDDFLAGGVGPGQASHKQAQLRIYQTLAEHLLKYDHPWVKDAFVGGAMDIQRDAELWIPLWLFTQSNAGDKQIVRLLTTGDVSVGKTVFSVQTLHEGGYENPHSPCANGQNFFLYEPDDPAAYAPSLPETNTVKLVHQVQRYREGGFVESNPAHTGMTVGSLRAVPIRRGSLRSSGTDHGQLKGALSGIQAKIRETMAVAEWFIRPEGVIAGQNPVLIIHDTPGEFSRDQAHAYNELTMKKMDGVIILIDARELFLRPHGESNSMDAANRTLSDLSGVAQDSPVRCLILVTKLDLLGSDLDEGSLFPEDRGKDESAPEKARSLRMEANKLAADCFPRVYAEFRRKSRWIGNLVVDSQPTRDRQGFFRDLECLDDQTRQQYFEAFMRHWVNLELLQFIPEISQLNLHLNAWPGIAPLGCFPIWTTGLPEQEVPGAASNKAFHPSSMGIRWLVESCLNGQRNRGWMLMR